MQCALAFNLESQKIMNTEFNFSHRLHFSQISRFSKVFHGEINCISSKNDLLSESFHSQDTQVNLKASLVLLLSIRGGRNC